MYVNIASPEFKADSHHYYACLRADSPICRISISRKQSAWLITRYDDVADILKDERFVKNKLNALTAEQSKKQPWVPKMFLPLTRNMLDLDAPDHTRLRALVHKAFTPRIVEQMRERIENLTNELIDAVERKPRMDVISDYALPLPTTIIAQMLGVPVKDRHRFHRWSSAIASSNPTTWGMIKAVPNVMAFLGYIRKLVRARRAEPKEDLISALVEVEESGEMLNEDELVAMIFLLLFAGYETTVNLIGNGTLALLQNRDQMERLRDDPTLIKSGVEELLRYAGPLETATERFAREDVTIGGATIPRGELVYAVIASANRDERQFANADSLDVTRDPNRHLAFGFGIHFCLGAPLARLEGQIAINTLLARKPDLRLSQSPESLRWRKGFVLRGLEALPVST